MYFGRTVKVFEDIKRNEVFTEKNSNRKIVISIFYQGKETNNYSKEGRYTDLFHPKEEVAIKNLSEIGVAKDHIEGITVDIQNEFSIIDSDLSFPVIVFSPGFGVDRDMTIFAVQSLIKAGYIIVTVGHIFDTVFTVFPNGDVKYQAKEIEDIDDCDYAAWRNFLKIRKDDIISVLDELSKINLECTLLKGKLDLNRIGVMGHSLGGAAVLEAAVIDKRIKAGVLLDGAFGDIDFDKKIENNEKLDTPFVSFRQEHSSYEGMKNNLINIFKKQFDENSEEFTSKINEAEVISKNYTIGQKNLFTFLSGYKSFIKLKNATHMTFTDFPVLLNKKIENGSLYIDRAYEIINEVNLKFFNEFLLGKEGEYQSFIENNQFSELCQIDSDGCIINRIP